jgi:hypothetical protein
LLALRDEYRNLFLAKQRRQFLLLLRVHDPSCVVR